MAKFALLQRQFLTKMYKSVGYLQNYPRTDKKKERKKLIQYTFELNYPRTDKKKKEKKKKSNTPLNYRLFVLSILFWFPQRTHYFWRVFRFLFMEHKQDYSVTSVKDVKVCF